MAVLAVYLWRLSILFLLVVGPLWGATVLWGWSEPSPAGIILCWEIAIIIPIALFLMFLGARDDDQYQSDRRWKPGEVSEWEAVPVRVWAGCRSKTAPTLEVRKNGNRWQWSTNGRVARADVFKPATAYTRRGARREAQICAEWDSHLPLKDCRCVGCGPGRWPDY